MKKVLLLGEPHVGKTTLANRIVNNNISQCPLMYQSSLTVQSGTNDEDDLEIFDIPGNFYSMWSYLIRECDIIVFMFDITDLKSFLQLQSKWLRVIARDLHPNSLAQFVLVGNKCEDERAVLRSEAIRFAKQFRMPYLEISARKSIGIRTLIETLQDTVMIDNETLRLITRATLITNKNTTNTTCKNKKKKHFWSFFSWCCLSE